MGAGAGRHMVRTCVVCFAPARGWVIQGMWSIHTHSPTHTPILSMLAPKRLPAHYTELPVRDLPLQSLSGSRAQVPKGSALAEGTL